MRLYSMFLSIIIYGNSLELEFDRKLETVTAGLPREFSGLLQNKILKEDAMIVIDYRICYDSN